MGLKVTKLLNFLIIEEAILLQLGALSLVVHDVAVLEEDIVVLHHVLDSVHDLGLEGRLEEGLELQADLEIRALEVPFFDVLVLPGPLGLIEAVSGAVLFEKVLGPLDVAPESGNVFELWRHSRVERKGYWYLMALMAWMRLKVA